MSYVETITQHGPSIAYALIFLTIFIESGLLVGFFLPGDTLLFGLGILAATGALDLFPLIALGIIASIMGDAVGYSIGRKAGPMLFSGKKSWLLSDAHLNQAKAFYDKYGKITIILARFIPVVRTFAPVVAGAVGMHYATFATYNVLGGIGWVAGMTLLGYFLGSLIPGLDHYIEYVLIGVVGISLLSAAKHLLSNHKRS